MGKPQHAAPKTSEEELVQARLRNEAGSSSCAKSGTNNADPGHEEDFDGSMEPSCTESDANEAGSNQDIPRRRSEKSVVTKSEAKGLESKQVVARTNSKRSR
jgi:hypothetical protein